MLKDRIKFTGIEILNVDNKYNAGVICFGSINASNSCVRESVNIVLEKLISNETRILFLLVPCIIETRGKTCEIPTTRIFTKRGQTKKLNKKKNPTSF